MSEYIDPSKIEDFKRLQTEGKHLASVGNLKESLKKFELAREICPTPKVLQRIKKLKEHLKSIDVHCGEIQSINKSNDLLSSAGASSDTSGIKCSTENAFVQDHKKITDTFTEPKVLNDIQNIQCHQKAIVSSIEPSDLSPISRFKFKNLKKEAKQLAYVGKYDEALNTFKQALNVCECPNVRRYIKELEVVISSNTDEVEELEDQASRKEVHSSDSIKCSPVDSKVLASSGDAKQQTQKVKDSLPEKLHSNQESLSKSSPIHSKETDDIEKSDTERKLSEVKILYERGRELAAGGRLTEALKVLKKAQSIHPTEKVQKRIDKLELASKDQMSNFKDPDIEKADFNQKLLPKSSPPYNEEMDESDTERKLSEVKRLYEEGRELAADGRLIDALRILKKAQLIHPTPKVQKRIEKIEELISDNLNDIEEEKMIEISNGFFVFHEIYKKLYPYQREGVAWMWKLYKMSKGGVLGDDMGLGKTFQIIAFVSGLIDADLVKHVLIIMPVSLLKNWEKEFQKWCPGISVYDFHSGSKKERERNLLRVQRRGHVLLTSYGMVVNNIKTLTEMDDSVFVWDYVILDEGHKIKNPTKTTKAVYEISAKNRLVLTGTPIQNNLKELWSLYDFVHQGTLLGSLKTFKLQYENPITRSREKDATAGEKRLGSVIAENLKDLVKPYFLRRTKDEIWGKEDKDVKQLEEQMGNMKLTQLTAKKNDLILWTYMSEPQCGIYKDFLHSDAVKSILVSKRSPLVELTTLKKICDHPRLLSQRACSHLGLNGELQKEDLLDMEHESAMASSIDNVTDESLLKESGKLNLVIELLNHLRNSGHRTLVFSLSRKILDMIHRILVNRNWKVMRLDGTISKMEEREKRIMKFQKDSSYPVFLLTTQVGGVGLTLTAADRVIIYDPSWNPATDAQAVDRVYRLGQQKDVVVYRLITCGTVEEKIYRRQVFKDSITRLATGATDPYRYFSKQELRELFALENPRYSATQVQLHEMHSSQRRSYDELETHISFLKSLDIFGISDHDLMFTKEIQDHTEDNDPGAVSEHFIKQKVSAAQDLIKMEASVVAEGIRLAGTYNRPYQETIPLPKKGTKDTYRPPVLPAIIDLTEDAQDLAHPTTIQNEGSFTKNHFDIRSISKDSSINIEEHTPKEKNKGNPSDRSSPETHKKTEEDAKKNKLSFTQSPLGKFKHFSINTISAESENAVTNSAFTEKAEEVIHDSSFNKTEKLRRSSFVKPHSQEVIPNEEMNLSVTCVTEISNSDKDEKVSEDLKPFDVTSQLLEKFQANLTHYMNDDIADLSFDDEAVAVTVKRGRKSCARKSTLLISESDTSQPNSASNSRISEGIADENEEDVSNSDDSSNSASLSFVPDSTPGTPLNNSRPNTSFHVSLKEAAPVSLQCEPELLSGKNTIMPDNSVLRKLEGGVKRITPLKVDRSLTQEDASFVQAMATSLIITPEPSPKSRNTNVESDTIMHAINDDIDDSPLKVTSKKNIKKINSESEESDSDAGDHSNIETKKNVKQISSESHDSDSDTGDHESNSDRDHESNSDAGDHSNKKVMKKRVKRIISESESSDSDAEDHLYVDTKKNNVMRINSESYERDSDAGDHPNIETPQNQSNYGHSRSHLDEDDHSETDNDEQDESNLEDEEIISNHSHLGTDSENDDQSDLERTFATCKERPESDSVEDLLSEEESDESGSVFSEEE